MLIVTNLYNLMKGKLAMTLKFSSLLLVIFMFQLAEAQNEVFTVKTVIGQELANIIPFVAEQRLAIFCEYPYLYKGNFAEEKQYLDWFSKLSNSVIVVAYLKDKPVGFITGTSFTD